MGNQEGFVLLPLKRRFRSDGMEGWPTSWLAVLVVLIYHENRTTRISYPAQELISIEAGIGKASVSDAIEGLAESGWFSIERRSTHLGRTRNQYMMSYASYSENTDPEEWFGINSAVIERGVWSVMPESVKRLYLMLRALSWDGSMGGVSEDDWVTEDYLERESRPHERFVDETKLDPSYLSELTGLTGRTMRRAKAWLYHNGIIVPNDEAYWPNTEFIREGLMMPDIRQLHAPKVRERLDNYKALRIKATPGAKASLSRMKKTPKGQGVLVRCINATHQDDAIGQ